MFGVSVPHYWLGMLLVILCSVKFALLPATGGGPIGEVGWQWDWAHLQFMLLPALTLSVIPTGIIARTVRSQVADILNPGSLSLACAPAGSTSRASLSMS